MAHSFVHVHIVALRYFAATARAGSMRQAAEVLSVAPSAVNRQILKLEEQLQVKLFDRANNGVELTSAGETLYSYIKNLERDLDKAIEQIDAMRMLRKGHVRIATEDGILRDFLSAELARFSAASPSITFSISVLGATAILDAVAANDVDVGLTMGPPYRSEIRRIASLEMPTGAVMLPDHPLAQRDRLTFAEINRERMLIGDLGYGGGAHTYNVMTEGRRHRPFVESNSSDSLLDLVSVGLGVAVRTPVGAMKRLAEGEMVFVPIEASKMPTVTLCIWTHATRTSSHAAANLAAFLADALPMLSSKLDRWRIKG